MHRFEINARKAGFVLATAMAAALVAGCSGQGHVASTGAPVGAASLAANPEKSVELAERRVERMPRDAQARAALAQTYLGAGRFQSAATTFADAQELGGNSATLALGTALADIGAGRQDEALAVLSKWGNRMPVGDYGLALALAGRPDDAVTVLTDAIRGGQGTARMRQNLAYAYALAGNWSAARVVAAQDVPADQLDARLGEWARESQPQFYQSRIAALLGAPVRVDPGQPAALALNAAASDVQMADNASVSNAQQHEIPGPAFAKVDTNSGELPPVSALQSPAPPMPDAAPDAPEPTPPPRAANFQTAAMETRLRAPAPARREPVNGQRRAAPQVAQHIRQSVAATQGKASDHLVQLGSFRTMEGAKRSWAVFIARNPALKGHTMRISEAMVNGRRFYRVAAEGFGAGSAQSMCSLVKGRGAGCFVYAKGKPLPGAVSQASHPQFAANDVRDP